MSKIVLNEGATPGATPAAGEVYLYAKAGGALYTKDDLDAEVELNSGGNVGDSNTVYLDAAGNDGTGTRGNAALPYLTWKAAVNACVDGDTLRIGPGVFTIAVAGDRPTWGTNHNNLTIIGAGTTVLGSTNGQGTVIKDTVNDGGHVIQPPATTAQYLELRNLMVQVTLGAGNPVYAAGTAGGGSFMGGAALGGGGLHLINCALVGATTSLTAIYVGMMTMHGVYTFAGATVIDTSNLLQAVGCYLGPLTVDYLAGDVDAPTWGTTQTAFIGCNIGAVTVTGEAQVGFRGGCDIASIVGSSLSGATQAPAVNVHNCRVDGIIDFGVGKVFPDVAGCQFIVLHCILTDDILVAITGTTPTNPMQAAVKHCALNNGITISAGAGIDLDIRGCTNQDYDGSNWVTLNDGTILPDHTLITVTLDGTSPDTVNYTTGGSVALTRKPDHIALTANTVSSGVLAAGSITAASFSLIYSINAASDVTVLATWS
jgi:hypothetical protein